MFRAGEFTKSNLAKLVCDAKQKKLRWVCFNIQVIGALIQGTKVIDYLNLVARFNGIVCVNMQVCEECILVGDALTQQEAEG